MATGHYKEVIRAKQKIKADIERGATKEDLIFTIGEVFGFGEGFVNKYVLQLQKKGFCVEHNGMLITDRKYQEIKEATNDTKDNINH